jgi:hypothetical protein
MKGLSLWYGIILFLLVAVVYLFASGRKKNIKQPANDTKGKYKLAAVPDLSDLVLPKKIFTVPKKEISVANLPIRIANEKPTVDIEKLRKNNLPVVAEPLPRLKDDTVLIKNTDVVLPQIERSVAPIGTKIDGGAMVDAARLEYNKLKKEIRLQ